MDWSDIKKFEGKEVNVVLDNGRVYTCLIKHIFSPNEDGIALIYVYDRKGLLVQFYSNKIQAIETKEEKNEN